MWERLNTNAYNIEYIFTNTKTENNLKQSLYQLIIVVNTTFKIVLVLSCI